MRYKRWFAFLNSIAGQMLLLLVLAMCLFLSGLYISYRAARDAPLAPPIMLFTERQIGIAEVLVLLPPDQLDTTFHLLRKAHPDVEYQLHSASEQVAPDLIWSRHNQILIDDSKGELPIQDLPSDGDPFFVGLSNPQDISVELARRIEELGDNTKLVTVYTRLPNGVVLSGSIEIHHNNPPVDRIIEQLLVFMAVCVSLLLIWAIVFLIRPIRDLAEVTDTIAKDNAEPQPAEISGPTEVRIVAQALNKMQDRITQLIDDRTRMLAAVGHDLRTPVTRLRLRADAVEPDDLRNAILRDLNMMDGLLSRLMIFFKKGQAGEDSCKMELSSLVESIVNEWSDAGNDVSMADSEMVTINARPNDLMRMLDNLIDNAIKYAGSCTLSLTKGKGSARLKIIDHGPGIADEDKAALLEPFARGDKARTMTDKSGFGLGLSIAKQVANNHHASLEMTDTPGGGLTIEIIFPQAV